MSRKPLPRHHIASLGGYARARKLGPEGLSASAERNAQKFRERIGEAAYREHMKRLSLRRQGYNVDLRGGT
jgi:hypothetical protein